MPLYPFRLFLSAFFALSASVSWCTAGEVTQERQIENLAAFARVYGYVRFFHPSDEAAAIDWDHFAIHGVEMVRNAEDPEELRTVLSELFRPIAPTLRLYQTPDASEAADEAVHGRVTYWQHRGVQLAPKSAYRSRRAIPAEAKGDRAPLFEAARPSPTFTKQVSPELFIRMPLVLLVGPNNRTFASSAVELDALRAQLDAIDLPSLTPADWRLRAAGVIHTWNVFQHFHPYLDEIELSWDEALRPALRRMLSDSTGGDYLATLSEIVAQLGDGHGVVTRLREGRGTDITAQQPTGGLPIRAAVIGEQIVVTGTEGNASFRKGDVITRLDGISPLEVLDGLKRYVSGSSHLVEYRALNQFGNGPLGSMASVGILRDGAELTYDVERASKPGSIFAHPIAEFKHPTLWEIRPGIFYVRMLRLTASEFEENLSKLAAARGVIFDNRWDGRSPPMDPKEQLTGYGHVIPHLIDNQVSPSPMLVPQIVLPDRKGWTYFEPTWPVDPKTPRFTGHVVFINEPSVVSAGETSMAMIAHHKLATLVGAATAGCNGNANFIPLPGDIRIMWTGMKVLRHDRTSFYGVGFEPDVPVTRTLQAVKEGRDEYLEAAVGVIEQARSAPSERPLNAAVTSTR